MSARFGRSSWAAPLLLGLLFVVFFAVAVRIQHIGVTRITGNPPFYETWFFRGDRSAEVLKVLSLQYDQLAADILWLRAIQSFGGRGMTNRDWRPIYNIFDAITELDPYFEPAYSFGHLVVGEEGKRTQEGLDLLRKGTFKIYTGYRLPFEGMYVSHWDLGVTDVAKWFGRVAMKRKDAPEWVERMVGYIEVQSGAYYIGLDRFLGNLLRAIQDEQPPLEAIAFTKMMETIEKWDVSLLSQAYEQYEARTGSPPKDIQDLAAMPALQNYETASMARLLQALERYAKALGTAGVNPDNLKSNPQLLAVQQAAQALPAPETTATTLLELQNELFKSALTTRSGIPEDPFGSGFVLNHAMLNNPDVITADKVTSRRKLESYLKEILLPDLRAAISERKEELGRNPRDLKEVFYTEFLTKEPFGGEWIYNPETGEVKSSSHPDW